MSILESLTQWLTCSERVPCTYQRFGVVDVESNPDGVEAVRSHLVSLLRSARIDPALLASLVQELDWNPSDVLEYLVNPLLPEREKIRRGEFGEVLFAGVLESFHGYHIPV